MQMLVQFKKNFKNQTNSVNIYYIDNINNKISDIFKKI